MTIGELLVVMNRGQIHQVGAPEACYRRPADTFVASFLGSPAMNFMDGRAEGGAVVLGGGERVAVPPAAARGLQARPGVEVRVGIRPEDIHPQAQGAARTLRLAGSVLMREPLGHETLTHLQADSAPLVARGAREFEVGSDGTTSLYLDADRLHIFWKDSLRRVDAGDEAAGERSGASARA
jgi:ABC-type sugar transport system ATPase subunit